MSIESVMDLQLSVMQPPETEAAANILKKARSSWAEMGAQFYDEHILPSLVTGLHREGLVIVGKNEGIICAAYDLPSFVREGDSVVFGKTASTSLFGRTFHGSDAYFAAEPEHRGIGTTFFAVFGKLLEQLASETGGALVHRVQATHRSRRLFKNCGYKAVHFFQGLQADYYVMEQAYEPVQHTLLSNEMDIVCSLESVMAKQLGGVAAAQA